MMVDSMMTIPEVAKYLKSSRSKVYLLLQKGEMPHVKIGRNVRVRDSDLTRYIDGNKRG